MSGGGGDAVSLIIRALEFLDEQYLVGCIG